MTTAKMVSFIVVNWNGKSLLRSCLSSICSQTCEDREIIFVDNGSTDDSVAYVRTNFSSVKLISLKKNRGFSGGNIEGLKYATGNFLALVNTDAILGENWLENMLRVMDRDPKIGICASKLIIDETARIDSVGEAYTTAFTSVKIGEFAQKDNFMRERAFQGASAAAVLYRKLMIDAIGFLDEDFFLNYEDTDFHMRAWLAGWKCVYVPDAVAYHKVSATLGKLSDSGVYHLSRNSEWVWIKNVPLPLMIRYAHHRIAVEFLSFLYFCAVKNKWRPFIRGKIDALRKVHVMVKKRKEVQKLVKLSNEQIRKDLMPFFKYLKLRLKKLDFTISR